MVTRAAALPPVRVTAVPPTLTVFEASTLMVPAVTPATRACPPTKTLATPLAPMVALPPTSVPSLVSNWSRWSSSAFVFWPVALPIAIWALTSASAPAAVCACATSSPSEAVVLAVTPAREVAEFVEGDRGR